MENKNIIIFSSIDWSTHRQLHHEFVDHLIKNKNKILFIENTGSRSFKFSDFSRIKKRIYDWFNSERGYSNINESLTIYSPIFIPLNFFRPIVNINAWLLSDSILKWLKITYFDVPIVFSFLPSPLVQSIISKINPIIKIYYCADLMSKSSKQNHKLLNWEKKFINDVDHVFFTSKKIGNFINSINFNNNYIPNGVNFEKFIKFKSQASINEELKKIKKPIVGYVGAIRSTIDNNLLDYVTSNLDYSFVFIGPILDKRILELKKNKNVFFIGQIDHNLIPQYINFFDVCMIPYKKNEFTDGIYPVKLNEYLAMGKIVISTNIDEVIEFNKEHNNIIEVASSKEKFLEKIVSIATGSEISKKSTETSQNIAKQNSWTKRFEKIDNIIRERFEDKISHNTINWKIYSRRFKFKFFKSFLTYSLSIFFIYFLIFVSPLYWYLGEKLTVNESLTRSDLAVVLNGTSDKSFLDPDYQKRVLKAINLFENNYVKKIYFSTGYVQNNVEIQFLKSFIESRGLSKDNFYIENVFPSSTYDSLIDINKYSNESLFKNIVILTERYHSLRVKKIWNSNFDEIDLSLLVDENKTDQVWNFGFKRMNDINYEYLSILYNYYLKRI